MNVSDLQVFARFLSEFFGGRAEVVLFDTKKVVSVHNPFDEDRAVGAPLGDVEQRLLSEQAYASSDYLANYRSLTRKREKLRSATFFIRGQSGEIAGMLTINLKVDRLIEARSVINELINGLPEADFQEPVSVELFESLNVSLEGHVAALVEQALAKFGVSVDRLTPKERRAIVKTLDAKGIFLIKGSVAEVARQTASSVPTIYRYLSELANSERARSEDHRQSKGTKRGGRVIARPARQVKRSPANRREAS